MRAPRCIKIVVIDFYVNVNLTGWTGLFFYHHGDLWWDQKPDTREQQKYWRLKKIRNYIFWFCFLNNNNVHEISHKIKRFACFLSHFSTELVQQQQNKNTFYWFIIWAKTWLTLFFFLHHFTCICETRPFINVGSSSKIAHFSAVRTAIYCQQKQSHIDHETLTKLYDLSSLSNRMVCGSNGVLNGVTLNQISFIRYKYCFASCSYYYFVLNIGREIEINYFFKQTQNILFWKKWCHRQS